MTWAGRMASCFPVAYLAFIVICIVQMLRGFKWWQGPLLIFIVYLLPLLIFRLHNIFFKVEEGEYDLSKKSYSPWWTAHMLQFPFIALPFLESLIHFIPGLYSIWIRAWGSKVGKRVYWTPRTEIIDRNLIEVGDSTLIGHMTIMVSHLVETRSGVPVLVLKKVRIGSKCLVSADAQLGPGAEVPDGTKLKPKVRLFWKGEWK